MKLAQKYHTFFRTLRVCSNFMEQIILTLRLSSRAAQKMMIIFMKPKLFPFRVTFQCSKLIFFNQERFYRLPLKRGYLRWSHRMKMNFRSVTVFKKEVHWKLILIRMLFMVSEIFVEWGLTSERAVPQNVDNNLNWMVGSVRFLSIANSPQWGSEFSLKLSLAYLNEKTKMHSKSVDEACSNERLSLRVRVRRWKQHTCNIISIFRFLYEKTLRTA